MRFTTPLSAAALLLNNHNNGVLAQASSGVFNVLAMNVAGLPAFLNGNDVPGDKTVNAELIGAKLSANNIDIAHLQEDFNYHAAIYRTNKHPYRTATSGGVPFGSGLNTVSGFDWVDFRRIKWSKCSDASQSDCLTPKGFTFMRVSIAPGVYADLYNLHADAGVEAGDLEARNSNINQVAEHINTWSKGNAVIVYGDFNSRYSRTGDTAIRGLLTSGLKDVWLETLFGNTIPSQAASCGNPAADSLCEVVDKVFYRAGPLLNLQAETFRYDGARFLQPDGNILTDHNPVFANFTWSAGAKLRQSALSGGTGGTAWFNDATALSTISKPKPSTLTFSGGSRLDSVSVKLTDGTTFKHGGNGGTAASLTLAATEYWTEAELCRGVRNKSTRNFYIRAVTSTGRAVTGGTATSDCSKFAAPSGWQIVGFLGQAGDEVDQLGFVYAPR